MEKTARPFYCILRIFFKWPMLPKVLDSGIPEGTSSSLTMPEEAKRGHRQSNAPVQLQDERDKGSQLLLA